MKINMQEVFDLFLLKYDAEEIRRFFGEREVTDEQIASMKSRAAARQKFRGYAAKVERRQGRLAARRAKREIRRAGLA